MRRRRDGAGNPRASAIGEGIGPVGLIFSWTSHDLVELSAKPNGRAGQSQSAGADPPWEGAVDGAQNLALDDELLRAARSSVRAAVLASDSVSLGVGQPNDEPAALRALRLGIPVLRRTSGGTGLLHRAGDLTWSIVLPRGDPRAGTRFHLSLPTARRGGRGVASRTPALRRMVRAVRVVGPLLPPGFARTRSDGWGPRDRGAAQHVTSSALLHQGTVSYRIDRPLLAHLFDLEETALRSSVSSLVDEGVRTSQVTLRDALLEHLRTSSALTRQLSSR